MRVLQCALGSETLWDQQMGNYPFEVRFDTFSFLSRKQCESCLGHQEVSDQWPPVLKGAADTLVLLEAG